MKNPDHSKQMTFDNVPPLGGLGVPEKRCGTCDSIIPPALLSCRLCAERESEIAIQLQKDEAVRRAISNLKRGGYVYPVVAMEKWKTENGQIGTRAVRHLRSRPSIIWTLCGVAPRGRTVSDCLAMEDIVEREKDLCPACFGLATGGGL
tara:strand:+ start:273 stop:719 length:447 start_codon:yes stop_codon:yes gene_type:complete